MSNRWVVALLWLILYGSFALLSPPLLDGADALHAEIAREMAVRGDPVTLYANGVRQMTEAPLPYWATAASMRLFGVGAAQARVPLALAVLLLALLVEAFARRGFQSRRAGRYAAAILLLSPALFFFTRVIGPDAFCALWFTAAICCFWQAESVPRERSGETQVLPCLGFAAACALGVLTAGPGGLLLPLATALLYLLWIHGGLGTLRRLGGLHPLLVSVVFAAVAVPWHVLAAGANPAEGHPLALHHDGGAWALRGWHMAAPSMGNTHGWAWLHFVGRYLPSANRHFIAPYTPSPITLVAGFLPWVAFLPGALRGTQWRTRAGADTLPDQQRLRLLLIVATALPLILWLLSSGGDAFPVSSLPVLCMLIANWMDREATEAEAMTVPAALGRAGSRASMGLAVAGTAAALFCAVLLLRAEPSPNADLAALLRHAPESTALTFALFARAAAAGALRGPLTISALALLVGTLLNWQLRRAYRPHAGNLVLAAATLLCLAAGHVALNTLSPVLSSQPLAAAVAPSLRVKNRIFINAVYETASTMGFYLERDDLRTLQEPGERPAAAYFRDAPAALKTGESLRQQWTGPERIFLWTDPARLPELPSKAYIVAEGGGKQIVSNKAGPY